MPMLPLLFSRLLEWDTIRRWINDQKKQHLIKRLPPNLPKEDFEQLPDKPGILFL
jgi:DNA polymerase-3 subunit epsilon